MPQRGGPAVLRAGDERDVRLPADLRAALREWSEVAGTVLRVGDAHEVDLLRRRARQLAIRAADALGRPVEFVDPISGDVESIPFPVNGAATNGAVTNGALNGFARGSWAVEEPPPRPVLAPEPPGPTPWGTGAAVAVFFAVLVAFADIVLARAFAGVFGLLWVPANLLVTAGTMPSLWLAREVPFWRWPAFGAAAGLAAAWIVLLFGLLTP